MNKLPADGCFLGPHCGLCWTRRCERQGIRPLPPSEWGRLIGSHLRQDRNDEEDDAA